LATAAPRPLARVAGLADGQARGGQQVARRLDHVLRPWHTGTRLAAELPDRLQQLADRDERRDLDRLRDALLHEQAALALETITTSTSEACGVPELGQ